MIKEGAMAAGAMLGSLADAGQTVVKYNSILNDSKSLAGYTAAARVEPSVFVGSDLIYKPWISDILQTTQSLFAGMWLTAADMVTAQINGVSVLQETLQLRVVQLESVSLVGTQCCNKE
jgi:hypothetical protein